MGLSIPGIDFGRVWSVWFRSTSPPNSAQVCTPVRRPDLVIDLNVKIKEENTFSDLEGTNQEK